MKPVLFVCVHNAGRSQMAEALFNHLAHARGLELRAASAGTAPGPRVNLVAAAAMEELGVPMTGHRPKLLTSEMAQGALRIITMGCGVEAGMCPAGTYISDDWGLPDPHGQGLDQVRVVRDAVRERVEALLDELAVGGEAA